MALADHDGTSSERLDLTSQSVAREERRQHASGPDEKAVSGPAPDAEDVEVHAVLRVIGELLHLLHPYTDEVVHGALSLQERVFVPTARSYADS
jgi:hypothetical protein